MKQVAKVMTGQIVQGTSAYLNTDPHSYNCPLQTLEDCLNVNYLCDIFKNRSNRYTQTVVILLQLQINARENPRDNQEWTIQRYWNYWAHKTKHNTTQKMEQMSNMDPTKKPGVNLGARKE